MDLPIAKGEEGGHGDEEDYVKEQGLPGEPATPTNLRKLHDHQGNAVTAAHVSETVDTGVPYRERMGA